MKTTKKVHIQFGSFQSPIKMDGLQPIHCFVTKNKKRVVEIHSVQKALGYEGKSETGNKAEIVASFLEGALRLNLYL